LLITGHTIRKSPVFMLPATTDAGAGENETVIAGELVTGAGELVPPPAGV
jgi:hypothetical protein